MTKIRDLVFSALSMGTMSGAGNISPRSRGTLAAHCQACLVRSTACHDCGFVCMLPENFVEASHQNTVHAPRIMKTRADGWD